MLIGTSPRYTLTDRVTGAIETYESREAIAAEIIQHAHTEMLDRLHRQCRISTRDLALQLTTPRKD